MKDNNKGIYLLALRLSKSLRITPGQLPETTFPRQPSRRAITCMSADLRTAFKGESDVTCGNRKKPFGTSIIFSQEPESKTSG